MRLHTQTRVLIAFVAVVAACLMTASSGLAAKPTVFTIITQNGVDSYSSSDPQCGITGQVTDTYRNVFHVTDRGDGSYLVHANVEGDTVYEADTGVTYTGHFHLHFDAVGTRGTTETYTQTLTINLVGDDGSHVSMTFVDRVALNANGDITTEFNKVDCR
jgi:hypothetical protein